MKVNKTLENTCLIPCVVGSKQPGRWKNYKILQGPQEERNPPKSIGTAWNPWLSFPALKGLSKVQSEIYKNL